MSNTGRSKKLASFNCDEKLWIEFIHRCKEKGTTATATLTRFISLYLDNNLDNSDAYLDDPSKSAASERLEQQIEICVNEYLEKYLSFYLDDYLATHGGKTSELHSTVIALSEKILDLSNRLADEKTTSSSKPDNRTSLKNSTPEREFWFIPERVKHLKLTINANQFIHIELFANDAYKERHGKLPTRQLFKKSQAFAYPVKDVDILDAAIKKVVALG